MAATPAALAWHDSRCEGLIEAASARPVPEPFDGAHYTIEHDSGFRPGRPNTEPVWLLTYVYEDQAGSAGEIDLGGDLGRHPSLDAAKAAAARYEHDGVRVVSGPHPPSPTVRQCDTGGEALDGDTRWWLVAAYDRGWTTGHGASCGRHLPVPPDSSPSIDRGGPPRSRYSDAVAAQITGSACERCGAEDVTDEGSGLGDKCIANNEGRVHL